ncbi:MAG: hypothetical protein LBS05_11010 [Tannerellaceae bacterium]|jgi:hypothetical protein|nr:hypothetical protein [Tannerellaceae bacterium]
MASEKGDWISRSRDKLMMQLEQSKKHIDDNLVQFDMQPTTVNGRWYKNFCEGPLAHYSSAYEDWKNPATRTRISIDRMIEAEREVVPAYRKLCAMMKANDAVSDADLEAAAFRKRPSVRRSPSPVATLPPGFEVIPMAGHQLRIDYFPLGEMRKSRRPAGQHGAEIKWGFSDTIVEDPDLLDRSFFSTSSPAILAFRGSEMGRKVYISLRWENTRALKGPWNVPVEAVIP